jgi:hypothetical protein
MAMNEPLWVQTDWVRLYAGIHDEVVAGLSQLMGSAAPEAAGVQTTHGPIASAVSAALSDVLGARQGTIQTATNAGSTISELLQKAAEAYERGDQQSAATLQAAAEALQHSDGANAPGGSGAAAPGDSATSGTAPDLPQVQRAGPAQTRPASD